MTSSIESSQDPNVAVTRVAKTYESQSESVGNKLKTSAQSAADTAKTSMKEIQSQLSNRWGQAKGYLRDLDRQAMNEQMSSSIRKHPWTAIGISFVVGAFIGRRIMK